MLIRLIEYLTIIIILRDVSLSKNSISNLIIFFIFTNLFFAILQSLGLIGSYSSLGYLPPEHAHNLRAYGIMGGSWELAIISCLCYFFLYDKKYNFIYLLIIFFLLFVAQSRSSMAAFIVAIFFLHYNLIKKNILLLMLVSSLFILLILIFDKNNFFYNKMYHFIFLFLESFEILKNFLFYGVTVKLDQLNLYKTDILSLIYRTYEWEIMLNTAKQNNLMFFFGSGFFNIYSESIFARIIYSFGLFGLILFIFISKKLPLYLLLFLIINGFTIDLFVSIKIYLIFILLLEFNSKKKLNELNPA